MALEALLGAGSAPKRSRRSMVPGARLGVGSAPNAETLPSLLGSGSAPRRSDSDNIWEHSGAECVKPLLNLLYVRNLLTSPSRLSFYFYVTWLYFTALEAW